MFVAVGALVVQFILAVWCFMMVHQLRVENAELRAYIRQHETLNIGQQETNNLRFSMLEAWRKEQEKQ